MISKGAAKVGGGGGALDPVAGGAAVDAEREGAAPEGAPEEADGGQDEEVEKSEEEGLVEPLEGARGVAEPAVEGGEQRGAEEGEEGEEGGGGEGRPARRGVAQQGSEGREGREGRAPEAKGPVRGGLGGREGAVLVIHPGRVTGGAGLRQGALAYGSVGLHAWASR